MTATKKPRRAWLYITDDDEPKLQDLLSAVRPHMTEASVLSMLAAAALRACERAGPKITLPLRFELSESIDPTDRNSGA